MLRNYFLLAIRNLLRNKVFSFINIFGLALGMAACILILQYVAFEYSYDQFHVNKDRLYRVTNTISHPGQSDNHQATNHPATGPNLKAELPEIKEFARIVHQSIFMGDVVAWSHLDKVGKLTVFNEEHCYDADPPFLTMFSFPFLYGDPAKVLDDPSSVVVSASVSRKFFGDEDPVGQTLRLNGHREFIVSGVFQDIPENSHIRFDILTSFFLRGGWNPNKPPDFSTEWRWAEFYTYVLLDKNADPARVEASFPAFVEKHMGEILRQYNSPESFHLQPLTHIHLRSQGLTKEQQVHGNQQTVNFLLIVAALIVVIAWINYVNLSTCKSVDRAQEVGIRKVSGATKRQLVGQFLLESFMVNLFAMLLAFLIVALAAPYFNQLAGKNIGTGLTNLTLIREPLFWIALPGFVLIGSFGAGLYPAFVLSSFRIVAVLKGKFLGSVSGILLRKILVGSQYAISVMLIAGTIMVYKQVSFMRSEEPGYQKDQLLVIKSPSVGDSTYDHRLATFKNEATRDHRVKSLAPTSEIPGKLISQVNFVRRSDQGTEGNVLAAQYYIDKEFIGTLGLKVSAGRNFIEGEYMNDKKYGDVVPVILNERGAQSIGFKTSADAVGQPVFFGSGEPDWKGQVVGVISNFHQRSLKDDYGPIIFFPVADHSGQFFVANVDSQNAAETVADLKTLYLTTFPGNQFEYFFLDDYFDRQYASDEQFGKVFGFFSALALTIACLGLFGLVTFMITQRMKEIAVRKVLGATIPGMVRLFSNDFLKLILIANAIALPVVYFLVDRWLTSFAFRVGISWMMFVIPGLILLAISLATVSYQTIRTGSINLVKSLRAD